MACHQVAKHSPTRHWFTAIIQDNLRYPAPRLRIGGFCWSEVLLYPHALADSNYTLVAHSD